ncbi:MAG: membrane associated rhomboid family serine protease [Candidatus Paceibacteria bacterium]|jgi:membrane associated rhomboid family serine protease
MTDPPYAIRDRAAVCVTFLGLLWGIELVNLLNDHSFHLWGILPRTREGLRGVLFAPYIHVDARHLALNSVPLLVLSWLVLTHGPWTFLRVTLTIQWIGGTLVWAFARPSFHLGASVLVLGYFGYLVAYGFLSRSWTSFFVAALTVLLYGGVIVGVLPGQGGVSWEMHLAGLIGGVAAAWAGIGLHSRPGPFGKDVGE